MSPVSGRLLAGCDVSSSPSRRKPVVLALGTERQGRVVLERFERFTTLPAFGAWLAAEEWDALAIRSADGLKPEIIPGYIAGRGLTMHELARRHAHWARQVGQSPVMSNILGARLRQLGFADPVKRRACPDRPAGRYYTIPAEVLDRSAVWMGATTVADCPTDPVDAAVPA